MSLRSLSRYSTYMHSFSNSSFRLPTYKIIIAVRLGFVKVRMMVIVNLEGFSFSDDKRGESRKSGCEESSH